MPRKLAADPIVPKSRPRTRKKTDKSNFITILPHSNENTNNIGRKVGRTDFLIDIYLYSGGREEVLAYLAYFGVPEVLCDLAIAQVEYLAAKNSTYMEVA